MKILKKILITLVILIGLLCLVSLFLPRTVVVERSLVMNTPGNVIFEEVNTLKNWEKWSPWMRLDPKVQLTYKGPQSGVGASYSWKSMVKNVGSGTVTVLNSVPGDSLTTSIEFEGMGKAMATYKFTKEGEGTKVRWSMVNDMGMNPMGKFFGLAMDKMIGPDFEKGLHYLDSLSKVDAVTAKQDMEVKKTGADTAKVAPEKSAN